MDIKDAILMVVLTLIGCATFLGSCYFITVSPEDSYLHRPNTGLYNND